MAADAKHGLNFQGQKQALLEYIEQDDECFRYRFCVQPNGQAILMEERLGEVSTERAFRLARQDAERQYRINYQNSDDMLVDPVGCAGSNLGMG
ncbi:MAG: hypothetical protein KAS93_03155 [Gammaproteobacteria bacterium]|nr:hypothetical protein [Gammaproteobacteria bacterium]